MANSKPKESDVRQKTALETGLYATKPKQEDENLSSEEYLAKVEEQINLRIDAAVATLSDGVLELCKLSSAQNKDSFGATEEAFQMDMRVQNMIKSAQSLLSISHALKMLFLLNAEEASHEVRDKLCETLRQQTDLCKKECEAVVDRLVVKHTAQ